MGVVVPLVDGVEGHAVAVGVVAGAGAEGLRGGPLHGVVEGGRVLVVVGSRGCLRTGSQTAMHWSVCWQRCSGVHEDQQANSRGRGRVEAETLCESWARRASR